MHIYQIKLRKPNDFQEDAFVIETIMAIANDIKDVNAYTQELEQRKNHSVLSVEKLGAVGTVTGVDANNPSELAVSNKHLLAEVEKLKAEIVVENSERYEAEMQCKSLTSRVYNMESQLADIEIAINAIKDECKSMVVSKSKVLDIISKLDL